MASTPPIIEILQYFIMRPRFTSDSAPFSNFLKTCKIPSIDRQIIKDLSQHLTDTTSITDLISPISDQFHFSSTELATLLLFEKLTDSQKTNAFLVIVSNAIAFLFLENGDQYVENLKLILQSLCYINDPFTKHLFWFLYVTILNKSILKIIPPPDLISLICNQIDIYMIDNPFSLDIIVQILQKIDDPEIEASIFLLIQKILLTYVKENIDYDPTKLVETIRKKVNVLDLNVLQLLPLLAKNKRSKPVSSLYSSLPEIISQIPSDFKEDEFQFSKAQPEFQYAEYQKDDTMSPTGIFDSLNGEFPDTKISKDKTTGTFLSPILRKQLKNMILYLNDIHFSHVDAFLGKYAELSHNSLKDFFAFIYFLTHINFSHQMQKIVFDALLWDKLFVQSATLFNSIDSSSYEFTSFYRERVLMIILYHGSDFLYDLFVKFKSFPFLFAESVARILKHLPNVYPISLKSQETLEILLKMQNTLRDISYKMEKSERNIAVSARSAIFQLIMKIFMNPLPRNLQLGLFVETLYDVSFSESILEVLTQEINISICIFLKNTFNLLSHSKPPELLMSVLMEHTSPAIINDPEAASTILLAIFDNLEAFPNPTILLSIIDILIKMFIKTHHCIFVKGVLSKLSAIIPKCEVKCYDQLFRLLAMSDDVDISSLFIITNPQFLVTVFSVFMNYGEIKLLVNTMTNLCDYSSYNRYQFYEGEIDLLLLDMIYFWPNDFEFRGSFIKNIKEEEELFNVTIPLFLKCASTRSSEVAAERMIKIISARENGAVSPIASSFIKYVSPIQEKLIPITTVAYPIGIQQPIFEIDNIPYGIFAKGSTASFYLYIDAFLSSKMAVKPTIFKVSSHKSVFMEMLLDGTSLVCTVYKDDKPTSIAVATDMPTNKWNMVIMKTHSGFKSLAISVSVDFEEKTSFHFFIKMSKNEPLKFIVGNSTKFHGNRGLLTCLCQLGSFQFYDSVLSNEEVKENWNEKVLSSNSPQPLFAFPVFRRQPVKDVHLLIDKRGFLPSFPNLLTVFRFCYPIDRFLPIFDKYNLYTSEYSLLLIKTMQGFFGPTIIKAFSALPHFFLKTEQDLLFSHYLFLFNYIEDCPTEKDKFLLIDNLLCNFEIWIRSPASELEEIIAHVSSNLFNACKPYFMQNNFFSKFLGFLRLFFSVSDEFESSYLRSKTFDSDIFISSFDNLMLQRAKIKFSSEDGEMILTTILSSNDQKLVEHLLEFFPTLLKFTAPTKKHIYLLLNVPFQKNPKLFPPLLKCLKASASDFYIAMVLLSSRVTEKFYYNQFFDDIILYPEMIPLAFMLALNYEKNLQNNLIDIFIEFSEEDSQRSLIKNCQFWVIWPIIFGIQVDKELQSKVALFLSQMFTSPFDQESFDQTIIFLKLFQASCVFDVSYLSSSILNNVYNVTISLLDSKGLDVLIKRFFLIMYGELRFGSFSNEMIEQFNDSPFSIEYQHPDEIITHMKTMDDLFKALHLDEQKEINFMISIRPIDQNLRSTALFLVEKIQQSNNFAQLIEALSVLENSPIKKKQPHITLLKNYTSLIFPFLQSVKENAVEKRVRMNQFFKGFGGTIRKIDTISVDDPLNSVKAELRSFGELNRLQSTAVMNNFLCTEQICVIDDKKKNEYRRCFTFAENFNTVLLKKSFKLNQIPNKIKPKPMYIVAEWNCKKININSVKNCMLYLTKNKIVIDIENKKQISIKASSIRYILTRTRVQKPTAIEFFTMEGNSYLLDFAPKTAKSVLKSFDSIRMKNLMEREDSNYARFIYQNGLIKKWESGQISNFEFLMKLNMFSGRSFKDPENSVIFPFAELSDGKNRDFAAPMPTQDSARLVHFLQVLDMNNYMFGTAPSNSMLLSYYFVRVEPYTSLHMRIHDGHFDATERMFTSYPLFFRSLIQGDEWKECSPEFYCFPEIFMDLNGTGIGDLETQSKSMFDFVYSNRKVLESEYASLHLGEWVDMIWGISQRSRNSDYWIPYLYGNCWENEECEKSLIPTMLGNLGSIPPQIFQARIKKKIKSSKTCLFHELLQIQIPKAKKKSSRNAFIFEKNGTPRLIICFEDGTIQRFSVNLQKKETEPVYLAPLRLRIPADAKYAVQRETVFIFDEKSERIHCVNFEQLKTVNVKMASIDFAVGCSSFGELITATKNGTIKMWKFPEFNPISLFSISIESISAVDVNQTYRVFICCTNDGYMRTYSIDKKFLLNSVNLHAIVEKILTTQNWSFIILYSPGYLFLLTINGFLIKKVRIDFEVYQWSTYQTQDGFDYVCCADPIGYIYTFEAYKLEKIHQIATCNERIIAVKYSEDTYSIVAHASSSTVYFIPL